MDLSVMEFMTAALFSLVAASIFTARMARRSVRLEGRPEIYLPCAPTAFPHAMPALAALGVSSNILQSMHVFHARASFAARLTGPEFERLNERGADHGGDLATKHAVWMSVCGSALLGLHFLYDEEGFPSGEQERSVLLIRDSIKAINQGGAPFVRSDGTVFIPGWLEHRRDQRRSCGWPVTLLYHDTCSPGVLQDISRSGMGLTSNAPMVVGMPVRADLQNGRRLEGVVVWVDGLRCGATFLHPLADDDPLNP